MVEIFVHIEGGIFVDSMKIESKIFWEKSTNENPFKSKSSFWSLQSVSVIQNDPFFSKEILAKKVLEKITRRTTTSKRNKFFQEIASFCK